MSPEDYMTAKDVKIYLKISTNMLYKLRADGLPFIKFEKKVLYRKADVDRFMEAHLIIPKPPKSRKK